jgi:hypothetical protein
VPLITLHTTGDPIVPYDQETLYTAKLLTHGALLWRLNDPIIRYGHATFTSTDVTRAFALLVSGVSIAQRLPALP